MLHLNISVLITLAEVQRCFVSILIAIQNGCIVVHLTLYLFTSLVPSGGENHSEAAVGVRRILRVQRPTADRRHHLCGNQERY